ncbi:EF-P 5-aminopentanol modification-associated protein YfmF [Aquibacillus sediminis]|uniref:EF-P 5-aminopentanol modification-associated protein YfmF n=1 Tax=Aquibacillus sediminis TaxID=2574734 RepID=UPI001109E37E|nr:pitrilysin family protein [Aquibacillus sediminis]
MQSINEDTMSAGGYNLHVIPSKKYKTINIVAKFKAPLQRETITQRALIPYVLQKGTRKYPSERELRTALDDLYGAVLNINSSKKGDNHIITVRMEVANENYLSSKQPVIAEAFALLNELLFHPKSDNNAFDQKIVGREKQTLKQKMDSIIDDKMSYANMRLIDEMCSDEPYRLHVHGYPEDLDKIDEQNLFTYYQRLLVEDQLDIYVLGDVDSSDIQQQVTKNLSREHTPVSVDTTEQPVKNINEVNQVTDEQNVQQAKLHLGFRTNIRFSDPDYFALQVFNGIFGGFPSSKLFMNVREKHSLAYYAASRFESHKGLLFVFSGIAPSDYKQAKDIILEQMEAMKKGDFTDEQIDETKNMVVNQLQETTDHPQGLIEVLYHQILTDHPLPPDDLMEGVKKVTKKDVLKVANKIALDTIYFLTEKGGSSDE